MRIFLFKLCVDVENITLTSIQFQNRMNSDITATNCTGSVPTVVSALDAPPEKGSCIVMRKKISFSAFVKSVVFVLCN